MEKTTEKIVKEAIQWVEENKGSKVESKGTYTSPRISSEVMDCSVPLTFDHYSKCSMSCIYCFSFFFKSNNAMLAEGSSRRVPFILRSADMCKMVKTMCGENISDERSRALYNHFYSKKFVLHWGGLADPFCNHEAINKEGLTFLNALGEMNYPTLFSFKGSTINKDPYVKLFDKYSKQKNFAFQTSIITFDDKRAKEIEIGVPPPSMRIKTMEMLYQMGYWTILRLRPFIIGITDETIDELLDASLKAGIKGISMEFFALDARANVHMLSRYKWLAKQMGIKNLMAYFAKLSPLERGTYRRLNWKIKEHWVKKVFLFCQKNKLVFACSDPDFKELCSSGSCCGMPDHYPPNPLLENWSHDQLAYHLKEARKRYHRTGERAILTFDGVYSDKATYLDDLAFHDDHVAVIGQKQYIRNATTVRHVILRHWENVNSSANPRNYFDRKLEVHGKDSKGHTTYIYLPRPYEEEWKKEGIDLCY